MNKRIGMLAAAIAAGLLAGCGGGSGNGVEPPPANVALALLQAQVDHPDVATQIAPINHLGALSVPAGAPTAPTEDNVCPEAIDVTSTLSISTAQLQTDYETKFCQLNAKHGVTLDSPKCRANIAYIKQQSGTGHFDLLAKPIQKNPLGVTGVDFKVINYTTKVALPEGEKAFDVSGGLMLPQGIPGSKVKGVVTYFHGTTFNKCMVGSNYIKNGETRLLAEVFASQGYIVVIPDYVGQGKDWKSVHPYVLYPQVTAKTAVDMLAAVAPKIRTQYQLDASAKLKLFSTGYSEGGAYSVWLTIFLNDQPATLDALYQLKHSVGMEGAYSTSKVTKGFLFDDVTTTGGNTYNIQTQGITNVVKPLLGADALLSYATYQQRGDVGSVFYSPFYALVCSSPLPEIACYVDWKKADMATAFAQPNYNAAVPILSAAMNKSANGATYPGPLEMIYSSKNSANSLVSATFLSHAGQAQLDAALKAADANLSRLPDRAVSITSLDQDSVVTPNNYKALQAAYPNKIRDAYFIPASALQVVSPVSYYFQKHPAYVDVDHFQMLIYGFLYALNTFNQF